MTTLEMPRPSSVQRPPLHRLGIRQLRAGELRKAAAAGELLGLTNRNQLVAVLVPVSQEWLDQLVQDHMSRILHSMRQGTRELLSGDVASLDSVPADEAEAGPPPLRRVAIRDLSGDFIETLAKEGRTVAVTSDGRLAGLLVPVTFQLLDQLVDRNFTRILQSTQLATKDLANSDVTALSDLPNSQTH